MILLGFYPREESKDSGISASRPASICSSSTIPKLCWDAFTPRRYRPESAAAASLDLASPGRFGRRTTVLVAAAGGGWVPLTPQPAMSRRPARQHRSPPWMGGWGSTSGIRWRRCWCLRPLPPTPSWPRRGPRPVA